MSETGNEKENENIKKEEEPPETTQAQEGDKDKLNPSGTLINTLITQSTALPEEKEAEHPTLVESPKAPLSPLVKSRQGSQVSFNLPPDATGKPVANQIEDLLANPLHVLSPVLSPANELSEMNQNNEENNQKTSTLVRSSFDAIPFMEDNGIQADEESKIILEKHAISPQSGIISKETTSPELSASPEEFHPLSPNTQSTEMMNIPVPMTEDRVPSAPDELKTTTRSTFEPIEFSGDEDNIESEKAEEVKEYSSSGSEFGSSSKHQQKKMNKQNNQTRTRELPKMERLPLEQLSAQSEQAEEAIEEFSTTGRLPSSDLRPKFVSRLEKDKINALENEDFDKVYDLEILSQKANEKMTTEQANEMHKEQIKQTKEKLRQANEDYRTFNKEWNKKYKETEKQCKERIQKVIESQEEELNEFDKRWNDENYLSRFAKPSPHLLQLKAQERSMVLAKLFDRAKEIRKQAAIIEAEDTRNGQQRAMDEMRVQKKNMTKRQDSELECINKKCAEQLDVLKRQKTIDEKPYVKRIKKLENQLESLKRNESSQVKQVTIIQTQQLTTRNVPERELPSVRAASRMLISRKTELPPKLSIKPLGQVTSRERKQRTIRVRAASSLK